jgi:hypothetical protein
MRRHQSVSHTFEDNITTEKAKLEAELSKLRPGPEMDAVGKKIRQLDIAAHMSDWLRSPGLKSPE